MRGLCLVGPLHEEILINKWLWLEQKSKKKVDVSKGDTGEILMEKSKEKMKNNDERPKLYRPKYIEEGSEN